MNKNNKPKVELIGEDGNAFNVLGICLRVAKKENWSKEKIDEFKTKAMSGDYDNLLMVVSEFFDIQ